MKKTLTLFLGLFFIIIASTFNSCLKDSQLDPQKNPQDSVIVNKKVIIADELLNNTLTLLDSNTIQFTGSAAMLDSVAVGSVLVSGIHPNAPYGYAVVVTAVQQNGDQYTFTTQPASLTDIFDYADIKINYQLSPDDTLSGKTEGLDPFNLEGTVSIGDISLSAGIEMKPHLIFECKIDKKALLFGGDLVKQAKFGTNIELIGTVSAKATLLSLTLMQADLLPPMPLGVVGFTIGPVPVVFVFQIKTPVKVSASLNGNISYTFYKQFECYAEYQDGETNLTTSINNGDSEQGGFDASVTGEIKASIKPNLAVSLYNALSLGNIFCEPYLKGTKTIIGTPDECNAKAAIDAGIELKLELLRISSPTFIAKKQLWDYEFYNCQNSSPTTTPAIQWQKALGGSFNDEAYSISPTADGGYIVAGITGSNDGDISGSHGSSDYWIVKLDGNGSLQWQKTLGGSYEDGARSISPTPDGGYIVAGSTHSNDGDVTGNHGSRDCWIVKLDGNGNLQWQKALGGSASDWAYSIKSTPDGGYIAAGFTYSNDGDISGSHGGTDYWIIKLDGSGNLQWQKTLGGSYDDYAESISLTSDGGYIAAGVTRSNNGDVTGYHGNDDYWIVKLDGNGDLQWQKTLGGSSQDYANSIISTSDGGYVVAGASGSNDGDVSSNHGNSDYWIVKLNGNGNLQWQKTLGGSTNDWAENISLTPDGGYIVAGGTNSNDGDVSDNHYGGNDYWIVKLDGNGDLQWQKTYGGSADDWAESINTTPDSGYTVVGHTKSNDDDVSGNHGSGDYWIIKLK